MTCSSCRGEHPAHHTCGVTPEFRAQFDDADFRSAYVADQIALSIMQQLRLRREELGWSQAELGRRANKPQSVIARLEDPDYGKMTVATLLEVAAALGCVPRIEFVPFHEWLAKH